MPLYADMFYIMAHHYNIEKVTQGSLFMASEKAFMYNLINIPINEINIWLVNIYIGCKY